MGTSGRRTGRRAIELLAGVAVFTAALLSAAMFTVDYFEAFDPTTVKRQGKASVKRGDTAYQGIEQSMSQAEAVVSALISGLSAMATAPFIARCVRSKSLGPRGKLLLGSAGTLLGIFSLSPFRAGSVLLSRLLL